MSIISRKKPDQKGFTLVELILTMALLVLVGSLGVNLFLATITARAKVNAAMEINQNAALAARRITYEIRRSRGAELTSDFGVNLATTPGTTLDLDMPDVPRDPTSFDIASGVLRVTQGTGSTINLTSNDVSITNLTIDDRSTGNGRSANYKITLTVASTSTAATAPNPVTVTATAEVRHP